jgi:hypothetical protein
MSRIAAQRAPLRRPDIEIPSADPSPLVLSENKEPLEPGKPARARRLAETDAFLEKLAVDAQLRNLLVDGTSTRP